MCKNLNRIGCIEPSWQGACTTFQSRRHVVGCLSGPRRDLERNAVRREPRSRVQLIGTTIKDMFEESSQFVTLEAAI
jgi:hypothetical protein